MHDSLLDINGGRGKGGGRGDRLETSSVVCTTFCLQVGLVLSSVANLVHLCGEDVGSNPACWTISCR